MHALLHEAMGLGPDQSPFPWQEDLLVRFRAGEIPPALDIPTGLGKTKVMAVWLIARALGAPLPRRLVYVVDRRAVVDQATEEALRLRAFVEGHPELHGALGLPLGRPFPISTLRGQHVDNREWLADPAAAALVIGTVDMVGSRLLFQGYGVSPKMRPYHAALLGCDALWVLDEAHLVPSFAALLRAVSDDETVFGAAAGVEAPVRRLRLLTLSATARGAPEAGLGLQEADRAHCEVRRRLAAPKRLRILALDPRVKLPDALARAAWDLVQRGEVPARCVVFSDSRDVARRAVGAIERLAAKSGAVRIASALLIGERRVLEREEVRDRLHQLGFLGEAAGPAAIPTFLFATSAGEVGVDLDADHLVCDWVPWERMVQRLGRVNRRGRGDASVVLALEPEPARGAELLAKASALRTERDEREAHRLLCRRAVIDLLERLPRAGDAIDVSLGALSDLRARAATDPALASLVEEASTPAPLRPALSRALVDAWAMTALGGSAGGPAIDPWLRGWQPEEPPQAAVVWRTFLPVFEEGGRAGGASWDGAGRVGAAAADAEVAGFFEAAPPHQSERLEADFFHVADWLVGRAAATAKALRETARVPRPASAATAATGLHDPKAAVAAPAEPATGSTGGGGVRTATRPAVAPATEPGAGLAMRPARQEGLQGRDSTPQGDGPEPTAGDGPSLDPLGTGTVVAFVLGPDGTVRRAWRLEDVAGASSRAARDHIAETLRHATLVLDARLGGLRDGLLDSDADRPPLTADTGGVAWLGGRVIPFRVRRERPRADPEIAPSPSWPPVTLPDGGSPSASPLAESDAIWRECQRVVTRRMADGEPAAWLVVDRRGGDAATEEERSTGPSVPQGLQEHQEAVARRARALAAGLGLSPEYTAMLAAVAEIHDVGKAAPRWQLAFHAPRDADGRLYAKTPGPVNTALLDGYRHEMGSLLWAAGEGRLPVPLALRDLALHLIAAHHGSARPILATRGWEDLPPSALEGVAAGVAGRFARLHAQWGPWTLAWWEALLRAADQQASQDPQGTGRTAAGTVAVGGLWRASAPDRASPATAHAGASAAVPQVSATGEGA